MSATILTPDQRIRVFLSSRLPEFPAERAALAKLIDEMGHRAIRFEETARPHPARKLYRAYLEQSHIFLGLYGTGYGWIDADEGMTISGVEDEWDLSGRLPRLVFIKEGAGTRDPRLEALLEKIGGAGVTYCRFTDTADLVAKARDAIALVVAEKFLADDRAMSEEEADAGVEVARVLAGFPVRNEADMRRAAERLAGLGARGVLLKGGHLDGDCVIDLLFHDGRFDRFEDPRIASRHTHGTGCTLASAIAAGLAQKMSLRDAVARARSYVRQAIETAPGFGRGHGPLNHAVTVKV